MYRQESVAASSLMRTNRENSRFPELSTTLFWFESLDIQGPTLELIAGLIGSNLVPCYFTK